jgi:hypothetical protein
MSARPWRRCPWRWRVLRTRAAVASRQAGRVATARPSPSSCTTCADTAMARWCSGFCARRRWRAPTAGAACCTRRGPAAMLGLSGRLASSQARQPAARGNLHQLSGRAPASSRAAGSSAWHKAEGSATRREHVGRASAVLPTAPAAEVALLRPCVAARALAGRLLGPSGLRRAAARVTRHCQYVTRRRRTRRTRARAARRRGGIASPTTRSRRSSKSSTTRTSSRAARFCSRTTRTSRSWCRSS